MSVDAWITLAVLVALFGALTRESAPPAAAMVGAVVVLVLARAVPVGTAFAGLSNPATITIAGLFVVARAIGDHAGLEGLLSRSLSGEQTQTAALLRLLGPVAASSSVIANTPLVATLAPMVRSWAERQGRAVSHFLMPLSFATILGGLITVIGTSTTLVVSGLVAQAGAKPFGFLEITPVGLPIAVVGFGLLVLIAPRVLPDRRTMAQQVLSNERAYTVRLSVVPDGPLAGKTVADAGLRNLDNVFLVRIDRPGDEVVPVPPDETITPDDELTFVGGVDQVRDLRTREGLALAEGTQVDLLEGDGHRMYECVVGSSSALAGRTLKEVSFRGRYGGAVVAIHRAGERVEGKLGGIRLHTGDVLLVVADPDFAARWRERYDFAVVVGLDDHLAVASPRRGLVMATVLAMVIVAAVGWLSLVEAVLGACAVLVGTRTVRFRQAREALDLDVLLIVAAAIGLGGAVQSSGLATVLAHGIEAIATRTGSVGGLAAIMIGTLILTELVTNVAAAALMVPIALSAAAGVGVDPHGYAIAVAVAASASFLTPIGYQTNTIVYGLGGYRFGDYWRLGAPLTATVVAVSLLVIPAVWS